MTIEDRLRNTSALGTNTVAARINVTGGNHSLAAGAGAVWVQGLDQDRISRIDPTR